MTLAAASMASLLFLQALPVLSAGQDADSQLNFETPSQAFARAELSYQEDNFLEAVDIYRSMVEQGLDDGTIYYNLGNAYFKAGQLGLAILSYERAFERMPSDADTRANLAFANDLIADAVEPAPMPLVIDWLVRWYQGLSAHGVSLALAAFAAVAGTTGFVWFLGAGFHSRGQSLTAWLGWLSVAGLVLTLLAGAIVSSKLWLESGRVDAIVLRESATVRSGPGSNNPQLAEIHEGLKVRVVSERQDWYQVVLPNGLTGWIRANELEAI